MSLACGTRWHLEGTSTGEHQYSLTAHRVVGRALLGGRWPAAPLLGAVTLTVLLRLPSLLEPRHYGDEGIFAAVAHQLLQGHTLYGQVWDDKPPLVYWLYAAVLALFGPSMVALRLLAAVWAAAAVAGVCVIAGRLGGRRAAWAGGVVAALLCSTPLIEAHLALTELFGAAPVVWAVALLLPRTASVIADRSPADVRSMNGPWRSAQQRAIAAGALLAVGFLFKQVFALDAVAVACWLCVLARTGLPRASALVAGFAGTVALLCGVLILQGTLGEGLYATIGFYGVYLDEGSGLPPLFALVKLAPALSALALVLLARRRRQLHERDMLTLWLGCAATGAVFGARPFGHYLVQAVAPVSVATGLLLAGRAGERAWRWRLIVVLGISGYVICSAFSRFWFSSPPVSLAYYGNAAAYVAGVRAQAAYEVFFSWRVAHQQTFAHVVRRDADRTLFIWGEYPWLYALADADNPTRYVTSYHTSFVPGAKEEVMEALRRAPPRYLVWERDEWRRLPGLAELVADRYERVAVAGNSELYRRRE